MSCDKQSSTAGVTSSIEDAVNELLTMTNKAVENLTHPENVSLNSSVLQDHSTQSIVEKVMNEEDMLEITQFSKIEEEEAADDNCALIISNKDAEQRVIDVTNALENQFNSDESILNVAGSKPDSYSSTPHSIDNLSKIKSLSNDSLANEELNVPFPVDNQLSPVLPTNKRKLQIESKTSEKEAVTKCSDVVIELQVSNNSNSNSSTASEVLIRSTRREWAKKENVQSKTLVEDGDLNVPNNGLTENVKQMASQSNQVYHSVKIAKSNLKPMKMPTKPVKNMKLRHNGNSMITQGNIMKTRMSPKNYKDVKIEKPVENGRSKLLTLAQRNSVNQQKKVKPTLINRANNSQALAAINSISAMPVVQMLSELKLQTNMLTNKLSSLEQQKMLDNIVKQQDKNEEVERKLADITNLRLQSIEQQQTQQVAWQTAMINMMGSVQKPEPYQKPVNPVVHDIAKNVHFDEVILKTPAPRGGPPNPTIATQKTGNNQLLKNILDQWDESNMTLSPGINNPITIEEKTKPMVHSQDKQTRNVPMPTLDDPQTKSKLLKKRQEDLEREMERKDIAMKFPNSIDQYLASSLTTIPKLSGPPAPAEKLLKHPLVEKTKTGKKIKSEVDSCVDDLWGVLKSLQENRKTLESNIEMVERGRSHNMIATKLQYNILSNDTEADLNTVNKLRIKAMVEDEINKLKSKKNTIAMNVSESKHALKYRRPTIQPKVTKPKAVKKPIRPKAKNRIMVQSDDDDDLSVADTENFVTHVYGHAEYHPRRSTVHKPFMHVKSPVKQPTFRKKQAIETVKANIIKSAKTQTSPLHQAQSQHGQYYFSPTASPSKHGTMPVHGQLAPMAIPLAAPRVQNMQPALQVHIGEPKYVTITTDTPKKKFIRIYNPSQDDKKSHVKADKDANLQIHKLPTVDISCQQSPDISIAEPEKCDDFVPGTSVLIHTQYDGDEDSMDAITMTGQQKSPQRHHGLKYPPCPPPKASKDVASQISKQNVANEVKDWVEQELMARIISELGDRPTRRDVGVPDESDAGQPTDFQLVCDAGLDVDNRLAEQLIEDELLRILRDTIRRKALEDEHITHKISPKTSPTKIPSPTHYYEPKTPIATPLPSPRDSVVISKKSAHTPSITPETSVAESVIVSETTPSPVPPRVPTPPELPLPTSPKHEIIDVNTPSATPPRSVTPPPQQADTPPRSNVTMTPEPKSVEHKQKFVDPWEGAEFPLDVELAGLGKTLKKPTTFAPIGEGIDLAVRTITPTPGTPEMDSLSLDTMPTSASDDHPDGTISEGQLVIEHGEVRKRNDPKKLQGIIGEIFSDGEVAQSMAFQSTLKDADEIQDFDPVSDGEVRLNMRPSMISKITSYKNDIGGDDPVGVYSRPRHPLPTLEEDDLSVGEVRKDNMRKKQEKFKKWKKERSLRKSMSEQNNDTTMSMGDLSQGSVEHTKEEDTYSDTQSISLDSGVIKVVPKSQDETNVAKSPKTNAKNTNDLEVGASAESGMLYVGELYFTPFIKF